MEKIKNLKVLFTSLVDYDGNQKIDLTCETTEDIHAKLEILNDNTLLYECNVAFISGLARDTIMLPAAKEDTEVLFKITDKNGELLCEDTVLWKKPREWTLYYMVSSHTDIGLHNSQYIQRYNSVQFLDKAIELNESSDSKYHYVMEGTWFWNNYGMDKGEDKAKEVADKYIHTGNIGVCAGVAGNHIQTYGLEEMCRSTYEKRRLSDNWNIDVKTMTMIDNNGLPWSMVQPYAKAGYENILFAPNIWNPIPSTIWKAATDTFCFTHNPNGGGDSSRMDIRYTSTLPMVFYWSDKDNENKLLVWGSTAYPYGGEIFGIPEPLLYSNFNVRKIEGETGKALSLLESKVPYDVWLFACYCDDQEPNMRLTKTLTDFNEKWQWPTFKSLGNPDEPFNILKEKFDKDIPVLHGDLTGGWYQHPLTAPEILAHKMNVDRLLPTAEKLAVTATVLNKDYTYPKRDFDRAWDYLLFNDEHSYGTSGYRGRRVFETWMQHRDWINKAEETAENEIKTAINAIAETVKADDSVLVFNPMLSERNEVVEFEGKKAFVESIPSFGYKTVKLSDFKALDEKNIENTTIENDYYVLKFKNNGSVCSIFDKELKRELLNTENEFSCNEFVYTNDNHKTFYTVPDAKIEIRETDYEITVTATTDDALTGAEIIKTTTLPKYEKRIDFDNKLNHVKDMWNTNRYYRYCYFAFPFDVKNAKRLCHLNGCMAEYGKDLTGHSTDVYMAVRDWCTVENDEFGVALIQPDTSITEFDMIHPDKTDCHNLGDGSEIYSYVANDWLQMHVSSGKYLDYHFRYSVVSYKGTYKDAKIADIAERITTSVITARTVQGGSDEITHSFASSKENISLVGLKAAENNTGYIARLYTNGETVDFNSGCKMVSTDETPLDSVPDKVNGFITLKIDAEPVKYREYEEVTEIPAPIGSVYTGLITEPKAGHTENNGELYLLWGKSMEENLSHYELYRSEKRGFTPSEENFVTNVEIEDYRVSRHIDSGLCDDALYFYRVRAVLKDGKKSSFSNEFSGRTREVR